MAAGASILGALGWYGTAAAAEGDPPASTAGDAPSSAAPAAVEVEQPALRRSGAMLGMTVAAALGGASGYPNDVAKIDTAAYYTNTGVGFGGGGGLFMGWAMADWVTFSMTVSGGALSTADHRVRYGGGGLEVDLFPAWSLGGAWQDLGVMLEAGIGFTVTDVLGSSGDPAIESGGASHFVLGAFYEGIRAWQFSMGPYAAMDLTWSPSAFRPLGCLGWRAVYYAGP
jgi:hypothetical protein